MTSDHINKCHRDSPVGCSLAVTDRRTWHARINASSTASGRLCGDVSYLAGC